MQRKSFLLTSALIIALLTFFSLSAAVAQDPPLPPDIAGEWRFFIFNVITDWWGEKDTEIVSGVFEIREQDNSEDPETLPNYFIDLPDTDDDFDGFVHDGIFAFYKENIDNCGGPVYNFGREIITGTVNESGTRMRGKGMGFDSKPDCGGTWSYFFSARKISE